LTARANVSDCVLASEGRESQFGRYFMKSKVFDRTVRFIAAMVLVGAGALAQAPKHMTLRGTINDFTPQTPVGGPWEVRGPWSLMVEGRSGKADFSAAVTMERSDLGVTLSGSSVPNTPGDLNSPMDRMAHTHHITLVDGEVTPTANGFQVTGNATITKDGSFPPPFGSELPMLTIQVTGGTGEDSVRFSNITVSFGTPAAGHFGSAPLHGVVRSTADDDDDRR
jgi:hypothetical protein